MVRPVKIESVRPLVRYVDNEQAVVDTHITTLPLLPEGGPHRTADHPVVYVMAELDGSDGYHDEGCGRLIPETTGWALRRRLPLRCRDAPALVAIGHG